MVKRKDEDKEPLSKSDMLAFLSKAFDKQATKPNLHGYIPHEKQLQFHSSTKKAKLWIGGNRGGKSVGGVVEDLWWATGRHPYRKTPLGPVFGRVIGTSFIDGVQGILFPIFKRWIVPSDLINGSWEDSYNKAERLLTLDNGSQLDFKSYDQDTVKHAGTSRDFIHFDEEPPKSIFDENMMRLVDTGGSWWITMTPVEGMTWVYSQLYEPWKSGKRHDLDVIQVSMSDNPHLSTTEKIQLLGFLDEDGREKREHGTFVPKGGLVFPSFQESVHATLHNWRPPSDWLVYHSVDHGFNNPAAHLHHAVSPNGDSIVTFHEIYKDHALVKDLAKEVLEWEQLNGIEPFLRTGDPAMKQKTAESGSSVQMLYSDEGLYLALDSVPRAVDPGVIKMNSYLQVNPKTGRPYWQISDCPNLTREMRQLHWDYYVSGKLEDANNKKETIHKKDDHAPDSARYFFTFLPDLSSLGLHMLPDITEIEPGVLNVTTFWDILQVGVNNSNNWNIISEDELYAE